LHNHDPTRCIAKWAVELRALHIDFTPQKAIKSQVLADFMVEWMEIQQLALTSKLEHWTMYFDGSLKLGGAGAGVLPVSPSGEHLKYVLQILWPATNNEAKYKALLHGLCLTTSLGIKRLLVYDDSSMVINQVNEDWDYTKETMDAYCAEVHKLDKHFHGLEFHHVVRDVNFAADVIAKLGSNLAKVPGRVFVQELTKPSIKVKAAHLVDTTMPNRQLIVIVPDWTQVFIDYIKHCKPPKDKVQAKQVIRRSRNYVLVGNKSYR
jgi:ribonuclease HI